MSPRSSNPDPLDFTNAEVVDAPAVRKVVRHSRGAEGVAAYHRLNFPVGGTSANHAPDIPRSIGLSVSCSVFPIAERKSDPLRSPRDARSGDVRAEILLHLVMTRHFVQLTFFDGAGATSVLLREVILDGERNDGPDAGEGVRHHGNDGAVSYVTGDAIYGILLKQTV